MMTATDSRILLVDDSAVLRKLTLVTLGGVGGFRFEEAVDAREGLERLTAERFDAIITDYYMPGMDGVEFVRQIRKRPEYALVPIVMISSEQDEYLRAEAGSVGVDAFVLKPFEPSEMRRVLVDLLSRKRAAAKPSVAGLVDAQVLIDAMPYPAMVLDAKHSVILGNTAFWQQTRTGLDDCGTVCSVAMHENGEPVNCPLSESVRTGCASERRVIEGEATLVVSVYPMDVTDEDGGRLFLHLARPAE